MKTYLAAFLLLLAQAQTSFAKQPNLSDLTRAFAECAGRYSAQMEYLWKFGDSPALALATRRSREFADLLGAVEPEEKSASARFALSLRVEVKAAHRALLELADLSFTMVAYDNAKSQAGRLLIPCESLLPGA